MSFLSILKKVGSVALGVEHIIGPTVSTFFPAFAPIDTIFQRIQTSIVSVEQANPVDGQGKLKSDVIKNDFASGLELTQSMLALDHKKLTYDVNVLQQVIDAQVLAYNKMAELKATFKVEPLA